MVAVGLPLNVSPSLEFRELNFGVVIVVHLGLENYPANYFPLFSKICLVCTFFSSFEESNCWFPCCVDEKVFLWPVVACFPSWVFFIALLSGFLRLFLLSFFVLFTIIYIPLKWSLFRVYCALFTSTGNGLFWGGYCFIYIPLQLIIMTPLPPSLCAACEMQIHVNRLVRNRKQRKMNARNFWEDIKTYIYKPQNKNHF